MATLRASLEHLSRRLAGRSPGEEPSLPEPAAALPTASRASRDLERGGTNVAALFDVLERETARASRYGRDLSIAVFDIPLAFARHRQLALRNSVASQIRGTDIPVWLSGNTLALVLPETGQGVVAATERITRLLSDVAGGPVAAGCARFPEEGRSAAELLRSAVRQKRSAPICAVGGAAVRAGASALEAPAALPESDAGADPSGLPGRRASDAEAPALAGGDDLALARAEFLRAALHLAELEALARDPHAGDAETHAYLRQLAADLQELCSAEECAAAAGNPVRREP